MILNSIHKSILRFLSEYNESSITLMQIGEEVGLDHPQKVQDKLNQLVKGGYIEKNPFGGFQVMTIPDNDDKIYLPFFGFAQCGNAGSRILDEYPKKRLPIDKSHVNPNLQDQYFITRAKGDSMEPFIDNGDFVLIKAQNFYQPENKVLIVINGMPRIKKVVFENGVNKLRSFNKETKDFIVEEEDDTQIVGIVINTFSKGTYNV